MERHHVRFGARQLRRLFLLAVVPILVLNTVESTAGDCRYSVGLMLTLCWALAERQRLEYLDSYRSQAQTATVLTLAQPAASAATGE